MVNSCIVIGCANRQIKGSKLGFYRLPKESNRRRLWLAAIRRKNYNPPLGSDVRVCGNHFISGAASLDSCNPDYIPTLAMGYEQDQSQGASASARFERGLKREEARVVKKEEIDFLEAQHLSLLETEESAKCERECPFQIIESIVEDLEVDDEDEITGSVSSGDVLHKQSMDEIDILNNEVQSLRSEKRLLGEKLKSAKFSYQFLDNDKKVKFVTGIPSLPCFLWLLKHVTPLLPTFDALVPQDVFLMVFIKLRLNLLHQDLGYRFGVSKATVSRILNASIPIIAKKLKAYIHWPDKGDVLRTLPKVFKKCFPRCRVIIDCTEIFVDRPGNLEARQVTWSNYKHNNTLKVLIGISPIGAVTFLSRAFGGRVSDKVITQRSGFLDLLEYNDQVLADRGFLISDDIASHNATLVIPAFTKGKAQLSQQEVEKSRQIARVRIHVERAIGRIKNFRILSTTMQLNMVQNFDSIITICAAVTNLLPKLVK